MPPWNLRLDSHFEVGISKYFDIISSFNFFKVRPDLLRMLQDDDFLPVFLRHSGMSASRAFWLYDDILCFPIDL